MIKGDLMSIKEQYDSSMQELQEFLSKENTWKDLSVEEFSEKSRLFKSLLLLSEIAKQEAFYSEDKLKEELQQVYQALKRLLL